MAGLSSLIANTTTSATQLPSWYDTAQQQAVKSAQQGAAATPQFQNTVAGQAINQLSGPSNPFAQAQGSLNTIAQGAANPWMTDASGKVTPNTQTAMGGLFAAQNQELNQLLPTTVAPQQGSNIASGNFGSLRGQTAIDTAKANAFAQLLASQNQAALQNQQTGVSAASGLGNVGAQGTQAMTTLGQAQMNAPLTATANLANILAGVKPGATVTNATQVSPLNQVGSLLSAVGGGTNAVNSLLNTISPGTTLANLFSGSSNPFAGNANGTSITGTGSTGDVSASMPTLPDGSLNPNYDAYADPNATISDIAQQNDISPTDVAPLSDVFSTI